MSTQIYKLLKTGSRDVDITITEFFGGHKKGQCLQLTAAMGEGGVDIQ